MLGKTTLARTIADVIDAPYVELDALNREPGWHDVVENDPAEFSRRMAEATAEDQWVVAGSYTAVSRQVIWPRLEVLIWQATETT